MANQTKLSHTHVHLLTSALDDTRVQVSTSLQDSLSSQSQLLQQIAADLKDHRSFVQEKVVESLEGLSQKLQQVQQDLEEQRARQEEEARRPPPPSLSPINMTSLSLMITSTLKSQVRERQ